MVDENKVNWAKREYGRSGHRNVRVRERLVTMGWAWYERPGEILPVVFPGEAAPKAVYCRLSNRWVTMNAPLEEHREARVERCRPRRVIFAIQDTTCWEYNSSKTTEGRVDFGGGSASRGVAAHAEVAFVEGGGALGRFQRDADFRLEPDHQMGGKTTRRAGRWRDGYDRLVLRPGGR